MISKKELFRKLTHIATGISIAVLYYYNLIRPLTLFLLIITGVLASLISKRINLPIISFFLNHLEREEHKRTFPGRGFIFFLVGSLLVMSLFEKDIALASLMVLTFGDSISHLVGGQFGQIRNIFNGKSKKLLEGTIAGTIAGTLTALLFVPFPEAFIGSFAAMIAEVVQVDLNEREVDDNLIVPIVAGTVMFLIRTYL